MLEEEFGRIDKLFDEHLEDLRECLLASAANTVCESAIERLMAAGFSMARITDRCSFRGGFSLVGWGCKPPTNHQWMSLPEFLKLASGDGIYVCPQVQIRAYRVDFLATIGMGEHRYLLAIECDGHDFHEKTKEQAKRDKSRDRDLLNMGVPVMRFTGSEIYKDPMECVDKVNEHFSEIAFRSAFPDRAWKV